MSDFSQNGIISTLHDFKTKSTSVIESELSKFSKQRKMELILPCLYSEIEGDALPKIVDEISKTKYLDHIIIGLDKANEIQAKKAWKFFKKLKIWFNPFFFLYTSSILLTKDDPITIPSDIELIFFASTEFLIPNPAITGKFVIFLITLILFLTSFTDALFVPVIPVTET